MERDGLDVPALDAGLGLGVATEDPVREVQGVGRQIGCVEQRPNARVGPDHSRRSRGPYLGADRADPVFVDLLELELERLERQRRQMRSQLARSTPASTSAPKAESPEIPAMQSK